MNNNKVREILLEMQHELEELSKVASEARKTVKLDQSSVGRLSRMDALQQQAMANATEARRAKDLYRIEKALALLDAGDYGFCEACDEEIPPRRLEIDPLATRCIKCAEKR